MGVDTVLFLALFAGQAGSISLAPVLARVASDFSVTTATAAQLRTVSGLAAGITALSIGSLARRFALSQLLLGGTAVLALGSLASALAPSFALLALVQVLVGVAIALLMAAGTTAAAEWVAPERRAAALAWALSGQAAGWVVGMPLIGSLAEIGWRYALLAFPLVAALAAGLAVSRAPAQPEREGRSLGIGKALADRRVASWATGELLASSAWAGVLVFAGALIDESYGASLLLTGVLLAPAGLAVIAGNLVFRRFVEFANRKLLARLNLVLAVVVPLFVTIRPGIVYSAVFLAATAFFAGARILAGSAFGLEVASESRVAVMGTRTAAQQFGYFVGAALGGTALASGGYPALGLTLGGLFAAATLARPRAAADTRGRVASLEPRQTLEPAPDRLAWRTHIVALPCVT